jgi:hypothetical protein
LGPTAFGPGRHEIEEGLKMEPTPEIPIKPMLNTPSDAEIAGNHWPQKVLSRLHASRVTANKIPMLFNMTDENGRVEREVIKPRYTLEQRNS